MIFRSTDETQKLITSILPPTKPSESIVLECSGNLEHMTFYPSSHSRMKTPHNFTDIRLTGLGSKGTYFYTSSSTTHIDCLLDNMFDDSWVVDSYHFEPCGYSLNSIKITDSKEDPQSHEVQGPGPYVTIHVTPEPEFSYASLETNSGELLTGALWDRLVEVFDPDQIEVVSHFEEGGQEGFRGILEGYTCEKEIQNTSGKCYKIAYKQYSKVRNEH